MTKKDKVAISQAITEARRHLFTAAQELEVLGDKDFATDIDGMLRALHQIRYTIERRKAE